MERQIKSIGVLTSGGDAPGMNAAVRAVVRTGIHKGYRMIGIQRGYNGLLNGECYEMNLRSVSNIIQDGGTILYTARCLEFKTKEGQDKGAAKCRELGIDALVVIGGDGSYRGARELAHRGIPMVGLPGTIDNDIACTDYTVGYDTAMNTAMEMIDKLRDTTQSHDRCSVVEVMGRNAGYIALNVAIASGAMAVLLPEHQFDMQRDILDRIEMTKKTGKNHFIIIVAEGVGHAQEIANEIQARTGIDSRATILGHVQRGGSPTLRDRVNASAMGYRAVCLIDEGKYNRIVGMRGETLVEVLASVEDPGDDIKPGFSVKARIVTQEKENVLIAPYETVGADGDGSEYVFVYRDGRAVRADVETGEEYDSGFEIVSGIREGDILLCEPERLSDGARVLLAERKEAA